MERENSISAGKPKSGKSFNKRSYVNDVIDFPGSIEPDFSNCNLLVEAALPPRPHTEKATLR